MRIYGLYFSPTGGTKAVVEILAEALGREAGAGGENPLARGEAWSGIDLSDREDDYSRYHFQAEDLCLIGVPSFGGRVPAAALERLSGMRGKGARAVLVAVYGNRDYDDTLLELREAARGCGFVPAAAVAAVAEHSIARCYGTGRPDEADRKELGVFAAEIWGKLEAGRSGAERGRLDQANLGAERSNQLSVPGHSPYRPYQGVPVKPKAAKGCTACGLCAVKCPVGAIPVQNPAGLDRAACISCMRCVALCPAGARRVNPVILFGAKQMLRGKCQGRKANELFLRGRSR